MKPGMTVVIAVGVFLSLATLAAADLEFSRFHMVDAVRTEAGTQNFLFRGNFPTNKTGLQYEAMMSYMRRRAGEKGNYTIPGNIFIIDVSFNNAFDDDPKEHEFWEKNPQRGKYINWPLGVGTCLLFASSMCLFCYHFFHYSLIFPFPNFPFFSSFPSLTLSCSLSTSDSSCT